jgi:hypothetical protein
LAQTPAQQKPPAADVVEVKETTASLKLQLALEKEKAIGLQAQALQTQAMQQIEPQLAPLRDDYKKQDATITAAEAVVRKENDLPPSVYLDRSPQSPTFGKWVKSPAGAAVAPAPKAAEPPKK